MRQTGYTLEGFFLAGKYFLAITLGIIAGAIVMVTPYIIYYFYALSKFS